MILYIVFNDNFHTLFLFIDDDETYDNPNLHSNEQDELEIPDGDVFLIYAKSKG